MCKEPGVSTPAYHIQRGVAGILKEVNVRIKARFHLSELSSVWPEVRFYLGLPVDSRTRIK